MSNQFKMSWPRIIAEGTAIVVSILLAFWVQAWWEGRQTREEAGIVLSALLEELHYLKNARAIDKDYYPAIQAAARKLLEYGRGSLSDVDDRQIDFWLSDTTWYVTAGRYASPVLTSIISNGDLDLLTNIQLRLKLAVLPTVFDGLRAASRRDMMFFDNQYLPFLVANSSMSQIYGADDGRPGSAPGSSPLGVEYPLGSEAEIAHDVSHKELVSNSEFQNLLVLRVSLLNDIIGWDGGNSINVAIDEAIELLEQELSK